MNNNSFGQNLGQSFNNITDEDLEVIQEDPNAFMYGNEANMDPSFFQNNGLNMGNVGAGGMYSHTPDTQPIASPFMNNFNYGQYSNVMNGFGRKMPGMERTQNDGRAPMTPNTPGLSGLPIGTPESLSHQAMLNQHLNQAAKMSAEQWNSTPGSGSWSPTASPSHHFGHPPISEVMAGKQSVRTKLEGGQSTSLPPSLQSQEAKKKRRRESHNLVERRRRDNINERIQDLCRLVPGHRLQDEALRKHIQANGAISSPSGISPPAALLAATAGPGRRATPGTITQGLPHDDKEKGPNKGDILNGAVAWMRDLMWMLYIKEKQQQSLKVYIENQGGEWPLSPGEEEQRMIDELVNVVEKVGPNAFSYSRAPGSGLYVPRFTDLHGDLLTPAERQKALSAIATSRSEESDIKNDPGSVGSTGYDDFYSGMIKEEDDAYGMDMG